MRIAILSDIHGNLPALEAVVTDISRHGVDAVVNLGDSLSGPLMPLQTAQFLMAQDWIHLAGNHERQLLTLNAKQRGLSDDFAHSQLGSRELEWLASLKASVHFSPEVFLCHGTPMSDVQYLLETVEPAGVRQATSIELDARLGQVEAELVACGHTHVPRSMRASNDQLIINPGSVGLQSYSDTHPHPHVIETGSPDARYAIAERLGGNWVCRLMSVPYCNRSMAALAFERSRPDWACALLTGRIA
jgi:putative phosphoesterase